MRILGCGGGGWISCGAIVGRLCLLRSSFAVVALLGLIVRMGVFESLGFGCGVTVIQGGGGTFGSIKAGMRGRLLIRPV